ncbi:MAG: metallopeptidase family protein [Deltaproteobacteria bacterium]
MDDPVDDLLDTFDDALEDGKLDVARQILAAADAVAPDDARVRYAGAQLLAEEGNDAEAREVLEALVAAEPYAADAFHSLGWVCERLGDRNGMRAAWLRVLMLDQVADEEEKLVRPKDEKLVARVAEATLNALPDELAARLENVAVVLEKRPPHAIVETGFDPRAYGLFEGPMDGDDGIAAPTRVVLFVANLVADFGDEDELLEEQVRITVLHEVGHFFGLDEDGVAALGLA